MSVENPRGGWIYRAWDEYGRLLYVGTSVNPVARLKQHRITGTGIYWYGAMRDWRAEWYPSEGMARAAESVAIATEGPLYNLDGNPLLAWYKPTKPPHPEWAYVHGGPGTPPWEVPPKPPRPPRPAPERPRRPVYAGYETVSVIGRDSRKLVGTEPFIEAP